MHFGSRPHKGREFSHLAPCAPAHRDSPCGVLGSDHPLIERTDHGELA
ncbi:MAG: hypothetical protein FD148_2122, partial [Methylocystaceae bacterium]